MKNTIPLALTLLWVLASAVFFRFNFQSSSPMSPNEVGDFLAGFFSPVALMWLVFGYYQQGEELRLNTEAIKLQVKELNLSVEQQKELVKVTQADLNLSTRAHDHQYVPREALCGSMISMGISEDRLKDEYQYVFCNTGNVQFAIKEAVLSFETYGKIGETDTLPAIIKPGEIILVLVSFATERYESRREGLEKDDVTGLEFEIFSAEGTAYTLPHSHTDEDNIWNKFELGRDCAA
ncbi:hypothetical protein M5G20_22060 [Pseudomonas sp. TNT2022 ID1044]|uniref:hypothetical protein n=1 Tax=Pseudomonas sp. TNT2022 ID1044 TaxID=2942636 RepID=UPI00235F345B|nr:hypothetical protein [Pseudomonas sp. TNT2022 ID1044]MDD0998533.1 hypothetical protein [Pseudomonas sp. TNT2022 ID1044]